MSTDRPGVRRHVALANCSVFFHAYPQKPRRFFVHHPRRQDGGAPSRNTQRQDIGNKRKSASDLFLGSSSGRRPPRLLPCPRPSRADRTEGGAPASSSPAPWGPCRWGAPGTAAAAALIRPLRPRLRFPPRGCRPSAQRCTRAKGRGVKRWFGGPWEAIPAF